MVLFELCAATDLFKKVFAQAQIVPLFKASPPSHKDVNEDTIAYGHEELAHWTEARVENCLELVLQDAYVRRQVNLKQRLMAQDLISQCLSRDPAERPTMQTVMCPHLPMVPQLPIIKQSHAYASRRF